MTATWDPPTVLRAAAEWSWVPPDAECVVTDVTLTRWPAWAQGRVVLTGLASERAPQDVLRDAVERARGWGSDTLGVWVSGSSTPDLTDLLLDRGARLEDSVDVLALPVDRLEPEPREAPARDGRLVVRRVTDVAGLRDADRVDTAVWDQQPLDDDRLADAARTLLADDSRELRVVAYQDGEPVASAGVTLAPAPRPDLGTVARLWGAGTMPDRRGRGAYRAVLEERLRLAATAGASLALVKGRVSTSARLLRRAGFDRYGEEHYYRLTL
ncbi:GNAT family N-acetyltransferase [Isoptericola variabilis]|uniref:GNAT family N-acetyltransferase n=1 Tax=Isoptericola variabilis TaxID=139208 RepID=UPI003D1D8EB2